jgi:hypothetical protein
MKRWHCESPLGEDTLTEAELHLPHDDGDCKSRFRLLAISNIARVRRNIAVLGDIPRSSMLGMIFVAEVAGSLICDAQTVQSHQCAMHKEGENRRPAVDDVHDYLAQKDEHAQNGNDDVVIRNARRGTHQNRQQSDGRVSTYNWLHTLGVGIGL